MSDPVDLLARVAPAPAMAMLTLRADLAAPALAAALTAADLPLPGVRQIAWRGARGAGWMSPDEVLLVVPPAEARAVQAALAAALAGVHHLLVDVSDARAAFAIEGAGARELLARLCPVDLHPDRFGPGMLRRTRLAQVPAAFWMTGEARFVLVCFRSVAVYVDDLLRLTATSPAAHPFGG
jgi:sarcosine oxidase subunit gamma